MATARNYKLSSISMESPPAIGQRITLAPQARNTAGVTPPSTTRKWRLSGSHEAPEPSRMMVAYIPALRVNEATMIQLIERLTELHDLPPDWDSYGARPISPRAEGIARDLLVAFWHAALIPDDPNFDLMPGPDGGLQLEWMGRNGELEIRVLPNGTFSILQILPDGTFHHPSWEDHPTVPRMKALIAEVLG